MNSCTASPGERAATASFATRALCPGFCVAEPLRDIHRVLQQVAVGAEEADDGIAQRRARLGRVADVLIAHLASREQRIAEDLPELSGDAPLVVFREALEVDVEGLAELEQEGNRYRALASLDQVQVARGDSELGCHARLGKPALPAEPAYSLACHYLALHGALLIVAADRAPLRAHIILLNLQHDINSHTNHE